MRYEIAVIGGGIAGYVSALRLSRRGKKVALIEKDKIGGVCLNYGCIPTKALISISDLFYKISRGRKYGIMIEGMRYDHEASLDWRNSVVERLREGVEVLLERSGVDVIKGEAKLLGAKGLSVNGEREIEAEKIIVATGSSPIEIKGLEFDGERVLSSTDVLSDDQLPESICIVGGGAIGVEIGQSLARLGVEVTIVEMMDQLLPGFSKDVVNFLARELRSQGVRLLLSSRVVGAERRGREVGLKISGKRKLSEAFEKILVAVGRRPNSSGIGLERIGVSIDEKGFVSVDEEMKTSVPNVYAVGDVSGNPMLAHKALADALIVTDSILGIKRRRPEIPLVVYSRPEVAKVGLSEGEARSRGEEVLTGKFYFGASGRALTIDEAIGVIKVIIDASTHEFLGMEICSPEASELISLGAIATSLHLRAEELAEVVMPHPTLSEAFEEAIHSALGDPIHSPR